jgi:hypothetical protein
MLKKLAIIAGLLALGSAAVAAPADAAKDAADHLVAQGCTIGRSTPRFIEVTCDGRVTRLMRMPVPQ